MAPRSKIKANIKQQPIICYKFKKQTISNCDLDTLDKILYKKLPPPAPTLALSIVTSVNAPIVVAAPISTSSSITTLPICGTLEYTPFSSGVKPKPSAPIIAPELMTQLLPIMHSE